MESKHSSARRSALAVATLLALAAPAAFAGQVAPSQQDGTDRLLGELDGRLRGQVEALRRNATPSNYIALDHLNAMEQGELRLAFEGVAKFQSFIEHHFKLQLLRN